MQEDHQEQRANAIDATIKKVLVDWVEAVDKFYASYHQLIAINSHIPEGEHYVGQCLVSQLSIALNSMHSELEILVADLTQIENNHQSFEQLEQHTMRLNKVTEQARVALHLASLAKS